MWVTEADASFQPQNCRANAAEGAFEGGREENNLLMSRPPRKVFFHHALHRSRAIFFFFFFSLKKAVSKGRERKRRRRGLRSKRRAWNACHSTGGCILMGHFLLLFPFFLFFTELSKKTRHAYFRFASTYGAV